MLFPVKRVCLVFFCLHINYVAYCQQDTTIKVGLKEKIKLNIIFGADRLFPKSNQNIYLPKNIQDSRLQINQLNLNFNEYTNVPQLHASVFAGLITSTEFSKGYNLHLDLIAEDLSQSHGALNLKKIIIYPRIYGIVEDSLRLFKKKFAITARLGDLINYKNNYGLTLDNIDVQGGTLRISNKNWWASYTLIGDVSLHVGLNIDDFHSYKIGRAFIKNNKLIQLGGSLDLLNSYNNFRKIVSAFSTVKSGNISYFTEVGYRSPAITNNSSTQSIAAMIRIELNEQKTKRFKWSLNLTARYYGSQFNTDFTDHAVRYRDVNNTILNGNWLGNYLYPLINTYRPFDQWSVYTEYQNEQILSNSIIFNLERKLVNNIFCTLDYEGNYIFAEKSPNATYNFYTTGLRCKLPAEINFDFYFTNKVMNLDVQYQTFYQSIQPLLGFSLRKLKI
jgi:hypothetical protein